MGYCSPAVLWPHNLRTLPVNSEFAVVSFVGWFSGYSLSRKAVYSMGTRTVGSHALVSVLPGEVVLVVALESLLCTIPTVVFMYWSVHIVWSCIQGVPIVLIERGMPALLEHIAYDWRTSSIEALAILPMAYMLGIWSLDRSQKWFTTIRTASRSVLLGESSFRLKKVVFDLTKSVVFCWMYFSAERGGTCAQLVPLTHLLASLVLPNKLMNKLVLEHDELRATDQVNGVFIRVSIVQITN